MLIDYGAKLTNRTANASIPQWTIKCPLARQYNHLDTICVTAEPAESFENLCFITSTFPEDLNKIQ